MTPDELILATGLDPNEVAVGAYAEPAKAPHDYALLTGAYGSDACLIIRGNRDNSAATATVSRRPAIMGELTQVEQERLRGVSQVANGMDAPIGQEAAIEAAKQERTADPVPYAPPVQPIPTPTRPAGEPQIESLDCDPRCFRMSGPEGTQDVHDPGCPVAGAA